MAPREVQPPKTTAEIGPRRAAAKKVRDALKVALGQEGLTDSRIQCNSSRVRKGQRSI
jgi:hypothetical protein